MSDVQITWLGGVKELKPIEYRVISKATGPWWWKTTEWAVQSEFVTLSGFGTQAEAETAAAQLRGL